MTVHFLPPVDEVKIVAINVSYNPCQEISRLFQSPCKFESTTLILFVEEVCDLAGLLCLHNHEEDVNVIKPPWSKKNGLAIDCLPACDEDDISISHIRDGLTWQE